ncbi:unnamed protein product [Symbiodinium sp. CCMP2456]|nr:unnamed protein product [Symbiodinium sp. CCMP2456]
MQAERAASLAFWLAQHRPVAEVRVDAGDLAPELLLSVRESYRVDFEAGQLALTVSPESGDQDDAASDGKFEMDGLPIRRQDAAASAKEYLEKHELLPYLQGLLETVCKEKPANPYRFLWRQLGLALEALPPKGPAEGPTGTTGKAQAPEPEEGLPEPSTRPGTPAELEGSRATTPLPPPPLQPTSEEAGTAAGCVVACADALPEPLKSEIQEALEAPSESHLQWLHALAGVEDFENLRLQALALFQSSIQQGTLQEVLQGRSDPMEKGTEALRVLLREALGRSAVEGSLQALLGEDTGLESSGSGLGLLPVPPPGAKPPVARPRPHFKDASPSEDVSACRILTQRILCRAASRVYKANAREPPELARLEDANACRILTQRILCRTASRVYKASTKEPPELARLEDPGLGPSDDYLSEDVYEDANACRILTQRILCRTASRVYHLSASEPPELARLEDPGLGPSDDYSSVDVCEDASACRILTQRILCRTASRVYKASAKEPPELARHEDCREQDAEDQGTEPSSCRGRGGKEAMPEAASQGGASPEAKDAKAKRLMELRRSFSALKQSHGLLQRKVSKISRAADEVRRNTDQAVQLLSPK